MARLWFVRTEKAFHTENTEHTENCFGKTFSTLMQQPMGAGASDQVLSEAGVQKALQNPISVLPVLSV